MATNKYNEEQEEDNKESTIWFILKTFLLCLWWIIKSILIIGFSTLVGATLSLTITSTVFSLFCLIISIINWVATGQIFFYWAPWTTRFFILINIFGIIIGFIHTFKTITNDDNWNNKNNIYKED